MAHDAYICYSTKDSEIANQIRFHLEMNNITCWIDSRDIKNSDNYQKENEEAIKNAKIFIVVHTENLENSPYCLENLKIAFTHFKQIISVNVDMILPNVEFSYYLKNAHWIMFAGYQEIVEDSLKFLSRPDSNVKLDFSLYKESEDKYIQEDQPSIYISQDNDDSVDIEIEKLKEKGYEITTQMDESSVVIIYITANTVNSSKIKDDIIIAFNKEKTIIPIYLDDSSFKFGRLFKIRYKNKIKNTGENSIRKYILDENEYHETLKKLLKSNGIEGKTDFKAESEAIAFESSNENNFNYLNDLIKNSNEILLKSDIVLEDNEKDFFENGIEINGENITIDGNGHTIDARNKAQIFNVKGDKITFKNINFINATQKYNGSVINGISSRMIIKKCTFKNNDGGAINLSNCEIEINDCEFAKNTSNGFGGALNADNSNVIINESSFLDNSGRYGGAIRVNHTELKICKSEFENNQSEYGGGINFNEGEISIEFSSFLSNSSKENGGAIETQNGILNISNSVFKSNSAKFGGVVRNHSLTSISDCEMVENSSKYGGVIFNQKGSVELTDNKFLNNHSANNIFYNNDLLKLNNTNFESNYTKNIIFNAESSNLSISGCEFIDNESYRYHIHNIGKSCIISRTRFCDEDKFAYNETALTLDQLKIRYDKKIILNKGNILVKGDDDSIESAIDNEGTIEYMIREGEEYDFTYLDELINTSQPVIKLDHDIQLGNYENDFFEGGIILDINNLVLDGDGHSIDGADKSRIFTVTGKNITLKNIIFKNGRSHKNNYENPLNNNGGVIRNNSKATLNIINCEFKNNISEDKGGAIDNEGGQIDIYESNFCTNSSKYAGGAILNKKYGKIEVKDTLFFNNISNDDGGAVENEGEMKVIKSTFRNNSSKYGGSIHNLDGSIDIHKSIFKDNQADNGGSIYNHIYGELGISDSIFKDNYAELGGAIAHRGDELTIHNTEFDRNIAQNKGGAIWKFSKNNTDFLNCKFKENEPNNIYDKNEFLEK